jgi:hypothetical protein
MDNQQKAGIGVLVAALLFFVVAVALQTRSEAGDASTASTGRHGPLASLGRDSATVRLDELGGTCQRKDRAVVVEGSCALEVAASGERLRRVRLRTGQKVSIRAPAPERDFDITDVLEPGRNVTIAVDRDGARITLDCGDGPACTLEVLAAAE